MPMKQIATMIVKSFPHTHPKNVAVMKCSPNTGGWTTVDSLEYDHFLVNNFGTEHSVTG